MSGGHVKYVAIGWATFAGTHLVLSHPPIRSHLIDKLGKERFLGVYSGISLLSFIPTTYIYAKYCTVAGPRLWTFGNGMAAKFTGTTLKLLGVLGFSQAMSTPSPAAMNPDAKEVADPTEPKGIVRITRHGLFGSFAVFGLGKLVTSGGFLGPAVYWGSYPLFWIIGSMHQDYRQRHNYPPEFYDKTSLLPFQAILEGRNSLTLALNEMNPKAAGIAIALYGGGASLPRLLSRGPK